MAAGFAGTPAQRDALQTYLDELGRWNRRINLTSIDPGEWWQRHINESVGLSHHINPAESPSIVDVGSGAGIPGIPLAILRPDAHLTLIDGDQRKAGFLTHISGLLVLNNVTVISLRAESIGHDLSHRERHDIAVSRATAALPALCELALPLVGLGGSLLAMVGDAEGEALRAGPAAAILGGGEPRVVAAGIVRIDKLASTPSVYPRRIGVPAKNPLH